VTPWLLERFGLARIATGERLRAEMTVAARSVARLPRSSSVAPWCRTG
jgi:hypothetical protein